MKSRLIYVVDDEKMIRDLITTYLVKEGYEVKAFEDGERAYKAFVERAADMLIIDIMMPGMDGYALCREIRKLSEMPIIMVSAKDEEIDRVLGLELGSDDYISKPFSPRELVARVRNIFRRVKVDIVSVGGSQRKELKCKDILVLLEERTVLKGDKEIVFTTKEYEFLAFLIENKNKAFTREQLLNRIWGYDYIGDTRAVDDLVKRVRKKLSKAGSELEITTVWGYGYKISE